LIPQITYCIAVWGNCAVAMFTEIDRLHIKVARIIHKIPEDILDYYVLDHINPILPGFFFEFLNLRRGTPPPP